MTSDSRLGREYLGVFLRFGVLALIPVLALGAILARELNSDIKQRNLAAAENSAKLIAVVGIQPLLKPSDMTDGLDPSDLAQIDGRLQGASASEAISRIKVWSRSGTIEYSDNHALIGKTFPIDEDLGAALAGRASGNITYGHDDENQGDVLVGPLIQVYVPLVFSGSTQPSGAFELYLPYGPVQAAIDRESNRLYMILAVGLVLFYAAMFPIIWVADRWRRRFVAAHVEAEAERQARDEAERLNAIKSTFLATMSHELRTPLNSILGFAQLMQLHVHGTLTEKQIRYVDNIQASGRHLLALIEDVLDLSKIEAGKLEVDLEVVSLGEVVSNAIQVIQPLADQKHIAIVEHGQDFAVRADRRRLTQVLVNLLSNAVKFTPDHGRITVRTEEQSPDRVRLAVEDTGAGIAPESQARVFEAFVQADVGGGRPAGGTGLGLPISRRLMRLMGGDVELISSTPSGSVFAVTVPIAAAQRVSARAGAR